MWTNLSKILLPFAILGCAIFLLLKIRSVAEPTESQSVELTTVYPAKTYSVVVAPDAGAPLDAGVAEVTVTVEREKVRPTAEQLANEYLIWELKDIEAQATTPEDKQLIHQALEIRLQRVKDISPSNDFEKNMKRAIK